MNDIHEETRTLGVPLTLTIGELGLGPQPDSKDSRLIILLSFGSYVELCR